eukprot:94137-Alexandrium_andersonii.AAC.1
MQPIGRNTLTRTALKAQQLRVSSHLRRFWAGSSCSPCASSPGGLPPPLDPPKSACGARQRRFSG